MELYNINHDESDTRKTNDGIIVNNQHNLLQKGVKIPGKRYPGRDPSFKQR